MDPSFVYQCSLTDLRDEHPGAVLTCVEVASQNGEEEEAVTHGKAEVAMKEIFGCGPWASRRYFLVFLLALIYLFPALNLADDGLVRHLGQDAVAGYYLPFPV